MAIEILDEIVANQIAAGEVVNRPSSVVKELMENSIDAGATRVQLVVKDAGRTLIQVCDNGCGMNREDAQKCFLPHATSKIRTADDLLQLSTMGFRGEALASIAAIAQVELKTRREEDEIGTRVVIEGGIVKEVCETACGIGTTISVKNIFYNTPARRNFLKSEQIENNHINDEFVRVALINSSIAFSYVNNEKSVHNLAVGNMKKRIIDLFGKSLNDKLIPINESIDLVQINGFVCSSESAKRNKSWQYFFVNGRFMKNNYFANAVDRVFANLIPEKTYPAFFITLSLDAKNIDINIHPTKTEVKFLDEKVIYSVLHASVKKSLGQYAVANEMDFSKREIEFPVITSSTPLPKAPQIKFNPLFNPFETSSEPVVDLVREQTVFQTSLFKEVEQNEEELPKVEEPMRPIEKEYNLMQIADKYILVKLKDSVLVVNQSRASQTVIYNSILTESSYDFSSQRIAITQKHFYPPYISFQLVELLPWLKQYGIEMEYDKNDGGFVLLSKPVNQTMDECFEFVEELVADISNEMQNLEEKKEKRALLISRKLKLSERETLSTSNMQTLISKLFSLPDCSITPDGEKVFVKIGIDDIEKLFDL